MSLKLEEETTGVARPIGPSAAAATATDASADTTDASAVGPASVARPARFSPAATVLRDARLLVAALWLGAAVYFSFAVAPSAFTVLSSRELAGAVVSRTLSVVNTGAFVAGLLLLLTWPLDRGASSRRASIAEAASLLLVAALGATGQWVIAARMQTLRAQAGRPIDELAATDPLRVAFASLHGHSVRALVVAMLAGAVALLLIARRARTKE